MTPPPCSILIFRNGSIGNTLAAVPAMRALRLRYPEAAMHVVVDPVGAELLRHCPWFQQLIVYDKRGADGGIAANARLVMRLRRARPTHAVLFKRFFRNGLLARLAGATVRAGFVTDGRAPFLNRTLPYDERRSVVDLNLALAALLDAPAAGRELELFLSDEDRATAADLMKLHTLPPRRFAVAHYGGLTTAPDFVPPERFVEILRAASAELPVVLIGAGSGDAANAARIAAMHPAANVQIGLPLRTTAALMEQARLFIGFNSGPAHMAAAVKLPELILFRPEAGAEAEIRKWLPPSHAARPLLPPAPENAAAWSAFLHEIRTFLPSQPIPGA